LKMLPKVFMNFRDLCLPHVDSFGQVLLNFSHEQCLMNCDLQTWFDILNFQRELLRHYGVGAIHIIEMVAFQDTELNVASLASTLIRLIL